MTAASAIAHGTGRFSEGLISTELAIYMGSNSMHTNTDDASHFQGTWLTSHGLFKPKISWPDLSHPAASDMSLRASGANQQPRQEMHEALVDIVAGNEDKRPEAPSTNQTISEEPTNPFLCPHSREAI